MLPSIQSHFSADLVSLSCGYPYDDLDHIISCQKSCTSEKIKSIVAREMLSLSLTFALTHTMRVMILGPLNMLTYSMGLLQLAIVAVAVNLVGQVVLHIYRSKDSKYTNIWDVLHAHLASSGKTVDKLSLIHMIGLSGPNMLIHELGHAFTASALFKKAKPLIRIVPFMKADTEYTISYGLTSLGSLFGKENCRVLTKAAGPCASLLFVTSEIAYAHFHKKQSPELATTLECHSISQMGPEIIYALNAYIKNKPLPLATPSIVNMGKINPLQDDFYALWVLGGLHPLVLASLFVAIPIFQKLMLNLYFPND